MEVSANIVPPVRISLQETIRSRRIKLTNVIAIVFAILSLPNIFTYYSQNSPMLYTTFINIGLYVFVVLLNRLNYDKAGRFLMAISMNILGSVNHAYYIKIGEEPNAIFYLIQLALLTLSFAFFAYHEWQLLLGSIVINCLLIMSIPFLNPFFEASIDRTQMDNPYMYQFAIVIGLLVCVIPLWVSYRQTGNFLKDLDDKNELLEEKALIEAETNWVNKSYLEFSEYFRNNDSNFSGLSTVILNNLCRKLNTGLGAIYFFNAVQNQLLLESTFGIVIEDPNKIKFAEGQGLVGECFKQKKRIVLTDLPADYFKISSGSGNTLPHNLMLSPIVFRNEIVGVLELGKFSEYTDIELKFLDLILQDLAVAFKLKS